jgi:hypothetical protein
VKPLTLIRLGGAFLMLAPFAAALETEIVPCRPTVFASELPTCCLKRTDTDLVLYKGSEELQRFRLINGPHIVTIDPMHDETLKHALQTLMLLRQSGACR